MKYVLAAQLVKDDLARERADIGCITIWNSHDERREKTGWLRDAVLAGGFLEKLSFGPEDYKADLDAANIAHNMEQARKNGNRRFYLVAS